MSQRVEMKEGHSPDVTRYLIRLQASIGGDLLTVFLGDTVTFF